RQYKYTKCTALLLGGFIIGRKAKYTFEQKLKAVLDYQSEKKSATEIASELDMAKNGDNRIREWSNLCKANGQEALKSKERNSSYSKEFKEWSIAHIFFSFSCCGSYSKFFLILFNFSHFLKKD
ncbi:transposase, partial [Sharpea azabuensis]